MNENMMLRETVGTLNFVGHSFCRTSCPLFAPEVTTEKFFAGGETYHTGSIVTCKYSNFCGEFAKYVHDGKIKL